MPETKELARVLHSTGSRYRHVTDDLRWAQEKEFALTIIQGSKNLSQATPESIGQAMLQAGAMGLSLNPILSYCYLIPRRARKRRQGESERDYAMVPTIVYASPSYKGLAVVCERSGLYAISPRAEVVFRADHYVYRGPVEKPEHVPTLKASERREEAAHFVYAVAKLRTGDYICENLDRETVQRIRRMSDFPNSIMWSPDKLWSEGWKKSAIRRLCKTAPKSPQMDSMIANLDRFEGGLNDETQKVDETGEPELCVTEDQVMSLHAMLTDHGIKNPDGWLEKLAMRYGVNRIQDLPASRLDTARVFLETAIKSRA